MFVFNSFKLNDGRVCKLVLPEPKYAESIYEVINSEREYLSEFLPWVNGLKSADEERETIKENLRKMLDKKLFILMIFVEDKPVGMVDLHEIKENLRAEVGYWLSEKYQGLGIITRSVELIMEYGFNDFNLHKIIIRVHPDNNKSANVAKRLNFFKEGTLVEHEILNGEFISLDLYSKINK